ncbi:MAG: M23 family metallopeptidase [Oscillospiraceae bacterium]|jgi:hypothetical protein|nr:M23 family metallopeptidase [Oscillospiraceae bacterium]
MNKRRKPYRGKPKAHRTEDSGGWKRVCVFGVLVGTALLCNVLFRTQIQEFRESLERGGYTEALSAIGSALSGEQSFSDAWSDAIAAITVNSDPVAAYAEQPEFTGTSSTPPGTGEVAFDLLKNGLYYTLPDDAGGLKTAGYILDPDDAVITFDFLEVPDRKEVTAYQDGIVIADGVSPLFGKYLIIAHADITAQYFHCGKLAVRSGDSVVEGQLIAEREEPS